MSKIQSSVVYNLNIFSDVKVFAESVSRYFTVGCGNPDSRLAPMLDGYINHDEMYIRWDVEVPGFDTKVQFVVTYGFALCRLYCNPAPYFNSPDLFFFRKENASAVMLAGIIYGCYQGLIAGFGIGKVVNS